MKHFFTLEMNCPRTLIPTQKKNDEIEQDQIKSSIQDDSSTNGDQEIDGNAET